MKMKHFTASDGLKLAYTDSGEGTPLLCLSGLTRNSRDFDDMRPHIPGGFRLITMDYRGRGSSDHDPNHSNYTIPIEARDAIELLDHLKIDKAAIIGTSRGGLIAMLLASTAKERLSGVLLNDIGPELEQKGLDVIMGFLGLEPVYKTYDEAAQTYFDHMPPMVTGISLERWRNLATRWFNKTPQGLRINYDPKLRDAVEEGRNDPTPDAWPLFDALEGLPLALLRGANSNLLSSQTAAKMRAKRPDMFFADVDGRGHVPFLDEPQSLKVIHAFLEELPK
jgi:pimeloyl-ACP methyl ester carboxylesterase